ncbi:alpha/beta-hydrolase [Neoconidiobolus thromboides FSU 785]|nr:alpha/beta-hydrolase [Neoconidiobolus thromboides FSU 785]
MKFTNVILKRNSLFTLKNFNKNFQNLLPSFRSSIEVPKFDITIYNDKNKFNNYIKQEEVYIDSQLNKKRDYVDELIMSTLKQNKVTTGEDKVINQEGDKTYYLTSKGEVWYKEKSVEKKYPVLTLWDVEQILEKERVYNKIEMKSLVVENQQLLNHKMKFQVKLLHEESYYLIYYDLKERKVIFKEKGVFNSIAIENKVYFTKMDSTLRAHQVWCLDEKRGDKQILYDEKRTNFFVDIGVTRDQAINSNTLSGSEIHLLELNKDKDKVILFHEYQPNLDFFMEKNEFGFILFIQNQLNGKMELYLQKEINSKRELLHFNEFDNCFINEVEVFKNYLAIYTTDNEFKNQLYIYSFLTNKLININNFPKLGSILPNGNQLDYNSNITQFYYSNPIITDRKIKINLMDNKLKLNSNIHMNEDIIFEREFIYNNSISIPITIIYNQKLMKKNKYRPILIYSYGAYGVNLSLNYKLLFHTLINMGWIIIYAHIRGGSELGINYYNQSKKELKFNGVMDLIQITEFVQQKYSTKNLFLYSVSAGAIASMNSFYMKNELYRGIVLEKPFLNIQKSLENENENQLSNMEIEEWGTLENNLNIINQLSKFNYLNDNKVVDNNILIVASLLDLRVDLLDILQFVEMYRRENNVYLYMLKDGGHINNDFNTKLKECSIIVSFLLKKLK